MDFHNVKTFTYIVIKKYEKNKIPGISNFKLKFFILFFRYIFKYNIYLTCTLNAFSNIKCVVFF